MARALRTAVAAASSKAERMQIVRGLCEAGVELCRMTGDGQAALQALFDFRPDLFVTAAQLPLMDGTSLAQRVLGRFELPSRPAVLMLYQHEYFLPERDNLASMGVHFLEANASAQAFAMAVDGLRQQEAVFTDKALQKADLLLDALGFPEHIGRSCLKTAALCCAADECLLHSMGARLYPKVGAACALDAAQAERAMRHAIDLAWQSNQIDNQYRIFSDTIDAGRGQPTCSEMISRLADILRLEG